MLLTSAHSAGSPHVTREETMRRLQLKSLTGSFVGCGTPVETRSPLARQWPRLPKFILGVAAILAVSDAPAAVNFSMYVSDGNRNIDKVSTSGAASHFATLTSN